MRTIQQTKMFLKRENVHCRVCKSFRVGCQVYLFFFFQAHRDEVITIVANPVVDQVISAGLGESKILCFVNNFENVHYKKKNVQPLPIARTI